MISGQPTPALWKHYENWWCAGKTIWLDKVSPRKDDTPDWHMLVQWKSKLFMEIYWQIVMQISINPSSLNLERLIWKFTALRNIILELCLAKEEELRNKSTIFQEIGNTGIYNHFLLRIHAN